MHTFFPRGLFFYFWRSSLSILPRQFSNQWGSDSPPEPPCLLEVQTDASMPGIIHFLKMQTGLNLVAADTGTSIREFL